MFTGLIQSKAEVLTHQLDEQKSRLRVKGSPKFISRLNLGDSVSVNGACLTVCEIETDWFGSDLSAETLQRTTLKSLKTGEVVNLELPLQLQSFVGGHLVLGHVDEVGEVTTKIKVGDSWKLTIRFPSSLKAYMLEKGSITVDGVSLTINRVHDSEIELMIIPHTLQKTNIEFYEVGRRVNLEADILAKTCARQVELWLTQQGKTLE